MKVVNVHEAKTHLSRLLNRISAGEEIIIAKSGKPVARLVPYSDRTIPRTPGKDKGLFEVPEAFDVPLPDDVLSAFQS
jgi:prevent-host-death family protein